MVRRFWACPCCPCHLARSVSQLRSKKRPAGAPPVTNRTPELEHLVRAASLPLLTAGTRDVSTSNDVKWHKKVAFMDHNKPRTNEAERIAPLRYRAAREETRACRNRKNDTQLPARKLRAVIWRSFRRFRHAQKSHLGGQMIGELVSAPRSWSAGPEGAHCPTRAPLHSVRGTAPLRSTPLLKAASRRGAASEVDRGVVTSSRAPIRHRGSWRVARQRGGERGRWLGATSAARPAAVPGSPCRPHGERCRIERLGLWWQTRGGGRREEKGAIRGEGRVRVWPACRLHIACPVPCCEMMGLTPSTGHPQGREIMITPGGTGWTEGSESCPRWTLYQCGWC